MNGDSESGGEANLGPKGSSTEGGKPVGECCSCSCGGSSLACGAFSLGLCGASAFCCTGSCSQFASLGHILGSHMNCVLRSAKISDVASVVINTNKKDCKFYKSLIVKTFRRPLGCSNH